MAATSEVPCPFCGKLQALPDADVVWQFPHSVALLGPWQFYHGYCILIARKHATELSHLGHVERQAYFNEMYLLAHAIELAHRPHKLNHELLGNQVPHLHWHLFPRYADDPDRLRPVWFALDQAERDPAVRQVLEGGQHERPATVAKLQRALQFQDAPCP
jgi:diadenosine tetraphosphate (Ap4A) HIT family hydrolase